MTLDDLAAHVEIQQVLYRYCRGVDRGDSALIASVYHPGAHDNHGTFDGPGTEFAKWIVEAMDQATILGQHHITNTLIELDGNRAHVESYFLAYHPDMLEGGKGEGLSFSGGRYLDVFEKRYGAWKITDRRVIFDFTRKPELPAPWAAVAGSPHGARRKADPSNGFVAARLEPAGR